MYSIPLVPPLPRFLSPQTLASRTRQFFAQPTAIKYDAIPLNPVTTAFTYTLAHSGILAHLPRTTCPICHRRRTAEPVPLSDTQAGSDITLPPLPFSVDQHVPQHVLDISSHEHGNDDTSIYVPAQSDCWGGCRWCYYCIQGELVKHRLEVARARDIGMISRKGDDPEREEERWTCLRCGGGVTRAWRVLTVNQGPRPSTSSMSGSGKGEEAESSMPN